MGRPLTAGALAAEEGLVKAEGEEFTVNLKLGVKISD